MSEVKLLNHVVNSVVSFNEVSAKATDTIPDGITAIYSYEGWNRNHYGQNVVVAVIDTGCDLTHPDLKDRIIDGRNFTTEGDPGVDFSDRNGHGTHVAGTIAASKNELGIVGVAPQVKLLILKVLNAEGSGSFYGVRNAVKYAIDWRGPNGEKVSVISMSLGGPDSFEPLHDEIKRAVANNVLVVTAAGNEGDGNSSTPEVSYPACYPEVICVGAYDMFGGVTDFSNTNDQIDIIAPGSYIYSTVPGGYATLSGTSMAAPHVSGALALLINHTDKTYKRRLTEPELFSELIKLASPLEDIEKEKQGNGLLCLGLLDDTDYSIPQTPEPQPEPERELVDLNSITIDEIIAKLVEDGILTSPDYWKTNLQPGKTVKSEYVSALLKKIYVVHVLDKRYQ